MVPLGLDMGCYVAPSSKCKNWFCARGGWNPRRPGGTRQRLGRPGYQPAHMVLITHIHFFIYLNFNVCNIEGVKGQG
jgi:hypothetical protein